MKILLRFGIILLMSGIWFLSGCDPTGTKEKVTLYDTTWVHVRLPIDTLYYTVYDTTYKEIIYDFLLITDTIRTTYRDTVNLIDTVRTELVLIDTVQTILTLIDTIYDSHVYQPDTSKWIVKWNPNSETDLAGYELHIWKRISKTDSTFGLAEPFPPGMYDAFMTAFDWSGNVSAYSEPARFKVLKK